MKVRRRVGLGEKLLSGLRAAGSTRDEVRFVRVTGPRSPNSSVNPSVQCQRIPYSAGRIVGGAHR